MHTSDPRLLILVGRLERAAKDGRRFPKVHLSLFIGGAIIAGELISTIEFAEKTHRVTKAIFEIAAEAEVETAIACQTTLDDVAGKLPEFLHLSRVYFWPHNVIDRDANSADEFWRVRISSVDAFHISDSLDLPTDA